MSNQDIEYLKNFKQYIGRTLSGPVLGAYYEAERILLGKQVINKRSCSCEYRSLATKVNDLYELWEKNQST
jgi:hypothetical protein